jgi:Transcriptional regulatory protein, C terminal/Chromate transporter
MTEPVEQSVPLSIVVREWSRIGVIGFGGPPAQIALLRQLCVEDRGWLSAHEFEDGVSARLTATELALLEILMQRCPATISCRAIALAVWNVEADALGSNTLDVHLARLRAKIAISGAKVEAVRALGYRVVPS